MANKEIFDSNSLILAKYLPAPAFPAGTTLVGTGTLVAGTVTIPYPTIATGDAIILTRTLPHGANPGVLGFSINNGVGFTVTSSVATDVGTFQYVIMTVG
jgi:hypothetical protein